MNLAHVHIILNHFPTIGTVIGLVLFVIALAHKNNELKRFALDLFLITGILVIPTYLSGSGASEIISVNEGTSEALIQAHQDDALFAFLFAGLTAAFAWLGLWEFRRFGAEKTWNSAVVLLLGIVTVGLMINTGMAGGEISHPEIRPIDEATGLPVEPALAEGSVTGAIENFIIIRPWVWPAAEILHFIGMALLFGVVLLINLRMLGVVRGISYASLHALLPWGMAAFALNLATGMLFFIGATAQYTSNVSFFFKIALVLLAGMNIIYFTVFDDAWTIRADDSPSILAKVMAFSTIVLWFGVIYFGRMMPYIGNSF